MSLSPLLDWFSGLALKDFFTGLVLLFTSLVASRLTRRHDANQEAFQEKSFEHQNEMRRKESHSQLRLKALELHESFWNSDELAKARAMISNEPGYAHLEPIMKKRMGAMACSLAAEEYGTLELIDRFYSSIMRLRRIEESLAAFGEDLHSARMIRDCYGYWVEILNRDAELPSNRDTLRLYLERFWPGIAGCLPPGESYGAMTGQKLTVTLETPCEV